MEPFDLTLWSSFKIHCPDSSQDSFPSTIDQITIDSRLIHSKSALFVALRGSKEDGHTFVKHAAERGARYALVESSYIEPEGLSGITLIKVNSPLKALQEICNCYRLSKKASILAICGSFGKTMLKDLLFTILSKGRKVAASPESFNSQIGVPLSLLQISSDDELAIIEAGISQLGEMDTLKEIVSPDFAILTGIGTAHLASLLSYENILDEKIKLLKQVPKGSWVLLPSGSIYKTYLSTLSADYVNWDRAQDSLPHLHLLPITTTERLACQIDFPEDQSITFSIPYEMPYLQNLLNMALKAAWLLGLTKEQIVEGLAAYTPELMQTETWIAPGGATIINNSYCADPSSVNLALKGFEATPEKGRKIFVFGGIRGYLLKAEHAQQIAEAMIKAKVHSLFLFGSQMQQYQDALQLHLPNLSITVCRTLTEAIEVVQDTLKKDDTVLIQGAYKQNRRTIINQFKDQAEGNQLIIHLSAISANIDSIRTKTSNDIRIMAMVKANGYGTDSTILSRFLSRCNISIVGVAHLDEAIQLRKAGITQAIFIINAALYEVEKLVKWDFEVGVGDLSMLQALNQEAKHQAKQIKVHLHIDTGMSRFGCRPEEALELAKFIVSSTHLELEGVMTHLACADIEEEDSFTMSQVTRFKEELAILREHKICPKWTHASNSSGTLRNFFSEGNMIRIGIGMFGLHPSGVTSKQNHLEPALTLTSKIAGINLCQFGETISYGRTYQVNQQQQRIGIIPLGYFDGIHRHYSGKGYVIIRGKQASLVGTICMDFFMVDLSNIPEATVGDPVLIFGSDNFGNSISPDEFARRGNTSCYELITCLGPRIQRVFIHN